MKKLAVQKGPVKANVKTSKMLPEAVKVKDAATAKKKKVSGQEMKMLKKC
jgi:hypothetical protein